MTNAMKQATETVTSYWVRRICAEAIRNELEELACNLEGAGPEAPWTGQEIADHIRDRIKNHPILNAIFQ